MRHVLRILLIAVHTVACVGLAVDRLRGLQRRRGIGGRINVSKESTFSGKQQDPDGSIIEFSDISGRMQSRCEVGPQL